MRRRNHYGYGAYRGRSKFRTFLKFVIAVLAVVLALLVGAFFFLQRYMVVSSTGGIYFDLPFLDREVFALARRLPPDAKADARQTKKALRAGDKIIISSGELYDGKYIG